MNWNKFKALPVLLVFPCTAFAQQIQTIPILPSVQEQQPLLKQQSPQTRTDYSADIPSEFEQYVSGKIEITEPQFEILKKYEGITFSRVLRPLPVGKIAVPVKVVRYPKSNALSDIDAGFLIGANETITNVFRMFGIGSSLAVSTDIRQFGYDLFRQPPSTFAPVDKVPVGPDYIIGPGDEVKVVIWGKVEGQWSIEVDRDGNINIPKIGKIGVTGLTFKELKDAIYMGFSKYFTNFEMNVSMGNLRSITVYVVGNANRPGAYTVSSLSTLVNALFDAMGPSKAGTMRDIRLNRNGKSMVHFDMYDFLLKGDKTKDIRLMPEDVIFIPPVGPVAAIVGSVNSPAIYELRGETKILQLIEMAGGVSATAFKGRIQIQRIMNNSRQVVFESDLDSVRSMDISLQSGDVVSIFRIEHDRKTVRLSGAVKREGEYGFRQGMTVKDLLSMADGIKYYAYKKEAELTRMHVTEDGPKTEKLIINLDKAILGDPENNMQLLENDYLLVRTVPEWKVYQTVTVSGEVRFPGSYTIKKGERLSSLIERAGGFTDRAYPRGAVFARERVRELQQRQINEMVERLEMELLGKGVSDVSASATYEEAKIKESEIKQKRELVEKLKNISAKGRMVMMVEKPENLRKTAYDIELEEGDSLYVPSDPQTIQVIGAVYNQTAFVYEKDKSFSDYIDMAGGYTGNANKKEAYALKIDGTASRYDSEKGLEAGDTLVIPTKLERIAWLREIKDITTILYQIAVTAGVLFVMF